MVLLTGGYCYKHTIGYMFAKLTLRFITTFFFAIFLFISFETCYYNFEILFQNRDNNISEDIIY